MSPTLPKNMDDAQRAFIKEVAKEVAQETLQELFMTMGYDMEKAEDRKELMADLSFLRKQRQTYAEVGLHVLKAIGYLLAIGVATAIWQYLKPK